ncbi:MAG: TRAP transporter substrate-binding protein DctP [Bacillota bacterium]
MNKKLSRSKISWVLIAVMSLTYLLTGCGGASENVGEEASGFGSRTLKIGHVRPEGTSTDDDINAFIGTVTEKTEGNTIFEVYPNSQLGDYAIVQERIGIGDIEMQLAPAAPNLNEAIVLPSAPYLASTWDEAREVFARDGVLYNEIEKMFEEENIKMLAGYPKYFGSIITTIEPNEPGDPYVSKGVKIRVPSIKSFELTALSLGYIATPIAFSEAFTSIQTGIVDGAIGSGGEGYWNSFRDVTEYYLPVNSHFEIWWLQMSMDVWNNLSAEEKTIVEEAAMKLESDRWNVAPDEEKKYEELLEDNGAVIIRFTDEEYKVMAEKVRKEVWPEIREFYGVEIFDKVTQQ